MAHNIKIIIAAHKSYRLPDADLYLPVQVGAAGKDKIHSDSGREYVRDDTGDNISKLNPEFCELTGLYWAWKNLSADYIGLVHYRRYFAGKKRTEDGRRKKDPFDRILNQKEADFLVNRFKVVLPKKRYYYIETLKSHYIHTHQSDELNATRDIIKEFYPDYLGSFDIALKRTRGYMFNMMIMSRDMLDSYCTWLFDILFKLRERIDSSSRTDFEKRYLGRISELLLNVWLDEQVKTGKLKDEDIAVLVFVYMEKINYVRKGLAFLAAKFFHIKHKKSF